MNIIKAGKRYNSSGIKQMYMCKKCGKKFTFHNPFFKKRFSSKIISYAWFRRRYGESAIEVQENIKRRYNIDVSLTTLYRWFKELHSVQMAIFDNGYRVDEENPSVYKLNQWNMP